MLAFRARPPDDPLTNRSRSVLRDQLPRAPFGAPAVGHVRRGLAAAAFGAGRLVPFAAESGAVCVSRAGPPTRRCGGIGNVKVRALGTSPLLARSAGVLESGPGKRNQPGNDQRLPTETDAGL